MSEVLDEIVAASDPRWQQKDWVNGYFPSGVPFRWRPLECQEDGCDEVAVACAVEGEEGHCNHIFSPESDYLADIRRDSLYCEAHVGDVL